MAEGDNGLVEGRIYTMPANLIDCWLRVKGNGDTLIELLLRLGDELKQQLVYGQLVGISSGWAHRGE